LTTSGSSASNFCKRANAKGALLFANLWLALLKSGINPDITRGGAAPAPTSQGGNPSGSAPSSSAASKYSSSSPSYFSSDSPSTARSPFQSEAESSRTASCRPRATRLRAPRGAEVAPLTCTRLCALVECALRKVRSHPVSGHLNLSETQGGIR
jgi:hypothetical protein